MISSGRFPHLVASFGLASLALSSTAFADVKLVQAVTVKNSSPQAGPRGGNKTTSTTAYYKGNKIRQESEQQVIIMDGDSKQVYTINMAQKTYQVTSLGEMPKSPFMDMMQFNTKVTITPTGRTKTIVGKLAKGYTYTADVKMSMNAKGQQMMKAQGAPPNAAAMLPSFRISGETWATEAIQVPPIAAQAGVTMLRAIPGMQDFVRKMGTVKGLPLESTTNVNVQGGPMGRGAGQGMQISTRTVTTQLSQSTLPASLFIIPAGYRKVAPAMPGIGRPSGARPPM